MRTAGEIHHPSCKITILNWNQKYLLKFERGPFEQTIKISETDVDGLEAVRALLTEDLIARVATRFRSMEEDLSHMLGLSN